jgi:hypothetical protein
MNRRRFLTGLGGLGALGASSFVSRAAGRPAPKRLLVLSHCHGWTYDPRKMRPGLGTSTPWNLKLGPLDVADFSAPLAPLYPHRSRMIAIDGLSLATAELDADGNRHDTGWVHAWTGDNADFSETDTRSTRASLDQLVAAAVARPDRLPSLELSIDDVN